MSYVKDNLYCTMQFSSETPYGEFYTFFSVKDLISKCEELKERTIRCRTIGILQSVSGRFYLTSLDSPIATLKSEVIQVSMAYLKEPPQSTVIPYPVQLFGTLQWKKGPVVFAKVLQVLTVTMAVKLGDAINGIVSNHLARYTERNYFEEYPT